jgi:BlaI family penicillinase repressor
MTDTLLSAPSRRERQIMDALYALGEAGVSDVVRALPDQPAYNTVRVMLGILEKKGFVAHRQEGQRYVYRPTIAREKAQQSAMKHVLKTFFKGSPSAAILALLGPGGAKLSRRELDEIAHAIAQARKKEDS